MLRTKYSILNPRTLEPSTLNLYPFLVNSFRKVEGWRVFWVGDVLQNAKRPANDASKDFKCPPLATGRKMKIKKQKDVEFSNK